MYVGSADFAMDGKKSAAATKKTKILDRAAFIFPLITPSTAIIARD
jgi:hypothetical protein